MIPMMALLALLLPMVIATALVRRVTPQDNLSTQIGSGMLLGLAFCGLIVCLSFPSATVLWSLLAALLLARFALILWPSQAVRLSQQHLIVFAALAAVLLLRGFPAVFDLLHLPVHAWDAYNVWTLRAKVWFGSGEWVAFAREAQYLQAIPGSAHFSTAAHYPTLPSLIQLYSVSAVGVWEDNLALLPWLFFLPALVLVLNGVLERAGVAAMVRVVVCYLLVSLPLFQAHIAHAGYADTLLCLALLVALSHWCAFLERRTRRELILALAFTALLPLIKLDGWLWISCLVAAMALLYAPARWLVLAWLALIVGLTLLVLGHGFTANLGPLGTLELSHEAIQLPGMTRFTLGFRNSTGVLAETLWFQATWNLFFWFAPILSLLLLKRWLRAPATRMLLVFLGFGMLAFVALFTLTSAAEFAETATASNRLLMPLVTVWIALLGMGFSKDAK